MGANIRELLQLLVGSLQLEPSLPFALRLFASGDVPRKNQIARRLVVLVVLIGKRAFPGNRRAGSLHHQNGAARSLHPILEQGATVLTHFLKFSLQPAGIWVLDEVLKRLPQPTLCAPTGQDFKGRV